MRSQPALSQTNGPALLLVLALALATSVAADDYGQYGFAVPSAGSASGSMLTAQHEPLNLVLSNRSDHRVLVPAANAGGLYTYLGALGFGAECFGYHLGGDQFADVGDGRGEVVQNSIVRYKYGRDDYLGTCLETLFGGNHIRVWRQANTAAYFLAASEELPGFDGHNIVPGGYDMGRNYIVGNATGQVGYIDHPAAGDTFSGSCSYRGWTYHTLAVFVDGLMPTDRRAWGVSEAITGEGVSDGLVAVLTVTVDED
ncbi:hypothetical protein Q5752_000906 [Cryptotrichosporon argae]